MCKIIAVYGIIGDVVQKHSSGYRKPFPPAALVIGMDVEEETQDGTSAFKEAEFHEFSMGKREMKHKTSTLSLLRKYWNLRMGTNSPRKENLGGSDSFPH